MAETTRVCTYDRPGTVATTGEDELVSRSDAIAQPRTTPEAVAELHALLQAAAIPGPYVLAGHSWGGFMARLYAATYLYSPTMAGSAVNMARLIALGEGFADLVEPEVPSLIVVPPTEVTADNVDDLRPLCFD